MNNDNIEERLIAVEEGLADVLSALEELTERQKETVELVQGHFEGLASTIREAEAAMQQAAEDVAEHVEALTNKEDGEPGGVGAAIDGTNTPRKVRSARGTPQDLA